MLIADAEPCVYSVSRAHLFFTNAKGRWSIEATGMRKSETSMLADILTYAGVYFVALVTLMYEILLTRIFSVTLYYHFAFMAVSLAMFGMTVGGIVVYLHPAY